MDKNRSDATKDDHKTTIQTTTSSANVAPMQQVPPVAQDDSKAVKLYQKTAQDHKIAQIFVGIIILIIIILISYFINKKEEKHQDELRREHARSDEKEQARRKAEEEQARRRAEGEQTRRKAEEERARRRNTMSEDIQKCFAIFELSFSASFDEVKKKYKVMMKVFHPDRHSTDNSVREYAEKKAKELNNAFNTLKIKHFNER